MRKGFLLLVAASMFTFALTGCQVFGSHELPGNGNKAMLVGKGDTGGRKPVYLGAPHSARTSMVEENDMSGHDSMQYSTSHHSSKKQSQAKSSAKRHCQRVKTSTGYTVKCKAANNNAL